MSPYYENHIDVQNEDYIAEILRKISPRGAKFVRTPWLSALDRQVFEGDDGPLIGMAEIKCRRMNHDRFDTYIISKAKWDSGVAYSRPDFSAVLYVAYYDCIRYIRMTDRPEFEIEEEGGRTTDTRRPLDIEPVIHIPITELTTIHTFDPPKTGRIWFELE